MDTNSPVTTFLWLLRMTADAAPAYFAVLVLPAAALRFSGIAGAVRAVGGLAVAHVGPLVMLAMGAWLYGYGRSRIYLQVIQVAVGIAGVLLTVIVTRPLSPKVPTWAFVLFFFGVAVITLLTFAVGAMALVNDWI